MRYLYIYTFIFIIIYIPSAKTYLLFLFLCLYQTNLPKQILLQKSKCKGKDPCNWFLRYYIKKLVVFLLFISKYRLIFYKILRKIFIKWKVLRYYVAGEKLASWSRLNKETQWVLKLFFILVIIYVQNNSFPSHNKVCCMRKIGFPYFKYTVPISMWHWFWYKMLQKFTPMASSI